MRGFWRSFFCGFVISLLACGVVLGQGSIAQISGTVRDQSGAVLPGVEITATQTDTGVSRNTISNETGSYVLPNLATGPYRLEAALPGFRAFIQTGIVLQVNANPTINVVLAIGQLTEQVEVQANASLVETRSVGVGQVIENERILDLPLNGRQVTDLIVLAGSAVNTGNASSRSMNGGVLISVAGGLSTGVAYILDGAMHNDPSNNLNMPLPFPDALQEFKVETSGLSAQNGMHSAASVNSVTKSGTNELHGDLFEFVRNGVFNARNAFAPKRDTLKRNQFGGTLGGPIKKNKLFFFGGYQGTITRSDPPETIRFVPTARMLAGDFTTLASTACRANAVTLSSPFVGNRVDPAQFSKAALFVASKLPKPEDECGTVRYGIAERPNELQVIGKVDYQRTDTDSWFGRYMVTTFKRQPPYAFTENVLVTTTGGRDNLAQAYALGNTHLIGANIVSSLRLAVNRTAIARTHKEYFSAQDAGIPIFSCLKGNMMVNVTNGFTIGGGTENNSTFRTTTYQIAQDLSVVRGSHQMAFGANLAQWRLNFNANVRCNGQFSFDGSQTSPSGAIGLADFLLGKPSQLIQAEPNVLYMHQWYFGLYGQDTWKVSPKLTFNYGVRWEPFFPQEVTNEHVYAFSEQGFRSGAHSSVFPKAPAGYTFPGDAGFPGQSGIGNRWMSLGPRVGLAWDVSGDGRTSVRASYAMSYDFPVGEFHLNTSIAPPWGAETRIPNPAGGFDNPYRDWPGGNPFPLVVDQSFKNSAFKAFFGPFLPLRAGLKMPSIQTWNLSIQRQVATDWFVSAAYLGNQSYHLWQTKMLNESPFLGTGSCTLNDLDAQGNVVSRNFATCSTTSTINQRRRLFLQNPQEGKYIGPLDEFDDGGTSSYHGLQLSVQRRPIRGVSVSGNYTWSHCLGDDARITGNPNVNTTYKYTDNRDADRGNCTWDRRQLFNLTSVAEMPQFANKTLRIVASGWKLSGIYRVATGSYLTITTSTDRRLNGTGTQRAQQILANPYGAKTTGNYLNPAAFAQPVLGTYGNMGPRNVQGPGTWQFDTALSRTFSVKENQRLEFRAEAFNVLNGVRWGDPNLVINSNLFGTITTSMTNTGNITYDPRIMQFALKYVF